MLLRLTRALAFLFWILLSTAVALPAQRADSVASQRLTPTPCHSGRARERPTPAPRLDTMALPRVNAAPRLDGVVDESLWLAIAPLPLAQYLPNTGSPLREASEIRLAYDDEYLYASARFSVRDASTVRANSMLRDVYAEDDYLNLIVDTFGDGESAVWFVITPNGTRIDGAISNDAEGPQSQWNHPEYDMLWDAVTQRTDTGWSAEVRIPLSTLRFQVRDSRVTMGVIAARLISRGKERYIFPAIRPTHAMAHFKPSLAARVTLEGIPEPRLRLFAPYVLLGSELQPSRTSVGTEPAPERRSLQNVGGDLKLGLSSRLTVDLTANTDFAQTEIDDARVNLSRFSLFYPEKRQFFLERASVFDLTTGNDDRLFYSRHIGLDASGRPVRVLGGGRIVGRVGSWDVGALDLQMDGDRDQPGANAAVLRARRNIRSAGSYAGAMATAYGSRGARSSVAAALDGTAHLAGDDFVVWSAAATDDSVAHADVADRSAVRVSWERRRRAGWRSVTSVGRIGRDYAPSLGYVRRAGVWSGDHLTAFGWFRDRGAAREQSIELVTNIVRRIDTRATESGAVESAWNVTWLNAATARLFARARRELLADTFRLAPRAAIAPGSYRFGEMGVSLTSAPGSLARVSLDVEGGRFFDGRRASATVSPTWNPSSHLELAGDLELNRVWLAADRGIFRGDVARFKFRLSTDPRTSVTGSVQYNRVTDRMTTALRFRRNVREGTDLYVVLNDDRGDGGGAGGGVGSVPGRRSTARTQYVGVKYVHTLR